jgi:hypothetical protein
MKTGVLFAFTSPLPGIHPAYTATQDRMQRYSMDRDRFVFVGSPFSELPHALLLGAGDKAVPEATLMRGWIELNATCARVIQPAISEGRAVVLSQCEYDLLQAVLYWVIDPDERARLTALNHRMVREVLVANGVPAPIYLTFHGEHGDDFRDLRGTFELEGYDDLEIERFLNHRELFSNEYFRHSGPNAPFRVYTGSGLSLDSLTVQAISLMTSASYGQDAPKPEMQQGVAA